MGKGLAWLGEDSFIWMNGYGVKLLRFWGSVVFVIVVIVLVIVVVRGLYGMVGWGLRWMGRYHGGKDLNGRARRKRCVMRR